jgi:hypothetical protein
VAVRRKRTVKLSKQAQAEAIIALSKTVQTEAELDQKEPKFQIRAVPRKRPEPQKSTKSWKRTVGWEWLWFACSLLGSWLLANVFEFFVPAETIRIAIGIFILIYAARLTVWSIKEIGKE